MARYTRKQHEQYLNETYADLYDGRWESVLEEFGYLTLTHFLWRAYTFRKLGSLLKKHDPIAFNVSYNEKTVKNGSPDKLQRV